MPMLFLKAALAFLISGGIAWIELVTSKYPRTIQLFWRRSWALWAYAAIYGLISLGFTLAYEPLARSGVFRLDIAGASKDASAIVFEPSWLIAILIGLSARALLHIRIFSVASPGSKDTFPVGTETIVQLFEPWLLRSVAIDDYNAVSAYLARKAVDCPDLKTVRKAIRESLPGSQTFPEYERKALLIDLDDAATVEQALESYLRAFGVATVEQRFPVPKSPVKAGEPIKDAPPPA
jgi:hypothetical protein